MIKTWKGSYSRLSADQIKAGLVPTGCVMGATSAAAAAFLWDLLESLNMKTLNSSEFPFETAGALKNPNEKDGSGAN